MVSFLQSGGPNYPVELGRYDGRISTKSSVVLPKVDFNLDQLKNFFSNLGLSQTDMIALSGNSTCQLLISHTLPSPALYLQHTHADDLPFSHALHNLDHFRVT